MCINTPSEPLGPECVSTRPLPHVYNHTTNLPSLGYFSRRLCFLFLQWFNRWNKQHHCRPNYYNYISFSLSTPCHLYSPVLQFCFQTLHCVYLRKQSGPFDWSHRHIHWTLFIKISLANEGYKCLSWPVNTSVCVPASFSHMVAYLLFTLVWKIM